MIVQNEEMETAYQREKKDEIPFPEMPERHIRCHIEAFLAIHDHRKPAKKRILNGFNAILT